MIFENRREAGSQLAAGLMHLKGKDIVVLGLPRGGVVTAAEVAKQLHAPLGVVFVRKIAHPDAPEYAVGAVAEGDAPVYDRDAQYVSSVWLKLEEESAREVIEYRHELYDDRVYGTPQIQRRTAILVDDGMATGLSMYAAVRNVRRRGARHIIVAAPVASPDSVEMLSSVADEIIIFDSPTHFLGSVGAHYRTFSQTNDMEVRQLLVDQSSAA